MLSGASPGTMLELVSGERQSAIPAGCDKYGPGKNEPTLPRVDMIY